MADCIFLQMKITACVIFLNVFSEPLILDLENHESIPSLPGIGIKAWPRKNKTNVAEVLAFFEQQLETSGQCHGCTKNVDFMEL